MKIIKSEYQRPDDSIKGEIYFTTLYWLRQKLTCFIIGHKIKNLISREEYCFSPPRIFKENICIRCWKVKTKVEIN